MNIQPLSDRVVIRPAEPQGPSTFLHVPDVAKDKPELGTIIAAGPGYMAGTVLLPMTLAVGDRVIFGKYSGHEIKFKGEDLIIMRETDVLAVVSE